MSYDYRGAGASYGAPLDDEDAQAKKGSVRAARERLQASQRTQMQGIIATNQARMGLPARPNQLVSQFSVPNSQNLPTPPSSSGNPGGLRSAPSPQWPLRSDIPIDIDEESDYLSEDDHTPRQSMQIRNPPPRPARPGHAPQAANQYPAAKAALLSPTDNWRDDEDIYLSPTFAISPNASRPITTSSRASTTSSLGSIPDFPVPNGAVPRRSPNLGPPPSARRGPSSYYSQHMSYVSPIVEESEGTRSHNSFASSNVIPNAAGFYFDDQDISPSDEDIPPTPIRSEDGRSSRGEDHDDQSNLVRKASLGKRQKPSLITTKSGNEVSKQSNEPRSQLPMQLGNGSALLDPSSSSDSDTLPTRKALAAANALDSPIVSPIPRSPLRSPLPRSPRPADNPVNAIGKEMGATGSTQGNLAGRVGMRRPPRLNVDAVREAEARGSLTSLPDLIRRATRLAANLDRGRTASRLGLDFYEAGALKKPAQQQNNKEMGDRRSGSLSDMLASFPPPGALTPNDRPGSQPSSQWPSGAEYAMTPSQKEMDDRKRQNQGRRCCGMPFWGFITLVVVLFLLIAAAVIIPIVLIVLPKQNLGSGTSAANTQCNSGLTCQNGGVALSSSDGTCRCVCTNGFTGATCTTAADSGCVSAQVAGVQNATLGSAIPRLLDAATGFNVPLNSAQVLSEFSEANLSCTAENALVTFNGLSSRSIQEEKRNVPLLDLVPVPTATSFASSLVTAAPLLPRAAASQSVYTVELVTMTTNGILVEASHTSAAATTSSTSAAEASTGSLNSNKTVMDFARVGVLFVLQDSGSLDPAVTAQQRLQTFLDATATIKGSDAKNLTLGSGFFINLTDLKLSLPNGTFVGLGSS